MKTLKKNLKKLLSLVLSVSLLIVFVPTSFPEVSALEEELFVNEDGYTYYDVMAGIISLEELYGPLSEDSVPDAVGYENALAKGHLRRRYDLEDGLYHIVFENTDGSLSSYYFDYPVKRENADGEVKDVSLEISAVEALGGLYAGQQSEVSTAFGLTSNEGILLQNDEVEIKLVPVLPVADPKTITPGMTAIGNIATSNITAIDNKKVSYEYDNSTTIEYSLTYTGFKEDIVVSEYTGQTEYYFTLETNGLTLEKIDDSYFLSENQEVKATLGDIIIFTADERNNSLGYMSHSVIKENEKYIITIHVDEAWLRDEDTAYPIRIDPTVEVANVSGAIEDVTINSNAGSSATSSTIFAGKRDSYGISRILMKFPGLDYENFANSEAITNAYVELRDLMCESEQLQINCFAFGFDWDEDTVAWSDFDPALHGSYLTNRTIHYANGVNQPTPHRYAFTITRAVKEWRAGTRSPDRGLLFKAANETELIHKTFASFNRSSYKPTLVVVYNNELSPVVWDGEYYINNKYYGKYLAYGYDEVYNTYGKMSYLGDSIKWEVVKVTNGYVIRSVDDTTKYLSVVANTASSGMEVVTHTSGTLPERCIWDFIPTTGGRLIKNVATGKYLYCSASGIYASTNLFAVNTASYNTAVWRNADVDYYTDRELQSFEVYNLLLDVGEPENPNIRKSHNNALWGTPENYSYNFNGNDAVSQTYGEFSATSAYTDGIEVSITHKPTGLHSEFKVYAYADRTPMYFINQYDSTFGSDPELMELIPEAVDFANRVYYDLCGITFEMKGYPSEYDGVLNECTSPIDQPCNCGNTTHTRHHKNVAVITNDILSDTSDNISIEYNERYVLWTDRPKYVYCTNPKNDLDYHIPLDAIGCVWRDNPVILFANILGSSKLQKKVCMSLGLIHEAVHTFGMEDDYGSFGHTNDTTYTCVMDWYVESEAVGFYTDVLSGDQEPFCASCRATLLNKIENTLAGWEE